MDDEVVAPQLYEWTNELYDRYEVDRDGVCAESQEEFMAKLEGFIRITRQDNVPSCWPLVNHIR